jgi:uncharacterized C2H2 Zn-finger protein
VEYLRRVHNFCLFCVFESDSIHELMRKCPGGHLRRPRSSLTSAANTAARASASGQAFPFRKSDNAADGADAAGSPEDEKKPPKLSPKTQQQLQRAFNWVKTYEDKIMQILDPDSVDIKKLGGKPLEEGIEEELLKFVKQEDEMKWRCKVPDCAKLFKGQIFWKKHVEKRHTEFYEKIKQDVSTALSGVESKWSLMLIQFRLCLLTHTSWILLTSLLQEVIQIAMAISHSIAMARVAHLVDST